MSRVKLLTLMAGPTGVFQPGQIVTISTDMATALVAGGYAEMVDQVADPVEASGLPAAAPSGGPPVELAIDVAPETATAPAQRRRGRKP
jgi:hypothetical protein